MQTINTISHHALQRLLEGNKRFTSGVVSIENIPSVAKLKNLAEKGQKPFAIILCCADSRAPTELIFDQGLGDLFVIRVAGNVVGPSLIASMEFAATKFGSPLIMVMGHTRCGAIQTTLELSQKNLKAPSRNLEDLVNKIKPSLDNLKFKPASDDALVELATWQNVENSKSMILEHSQILSQLVKDNKLAIVGSVFNLDTGEVKMEEHLETIKLKAV